MFRGGQWLPMQDFFKRRARRGPDGLAFLNQFERSTQRGSEHGLSRSQRPVKIDLSKHVVAGLEIFFNCIDATRGDIDSIACLVDLKRVDDPLEIVKTVLSPGHQ